MSTSSLLSIWISDNHVIINDEPPKISSNESYLRIIAYTDHSKNFISRIKIRFYNNSFNINEDISDENIFHTILTSINGKGTNLYAKFNHQFKMFNNDDILIISKEYSKYDIYDDYFKSFILGIVSYVTFLILIENGLFSQIYSFST